MLKNAENSVLTLSFTQSAYCKWSVGPFKDVPKRETYLRKGIDIMGADARKTGSNNKEKKQ